MTVGAVGLAGGGEGLRVQEPRPGGQWVKVRHDG